MFVRKILVAEDDKDDKDLFYEFMEGHEQVTLLPIAENGEEIFEYLDSCNEQAIPDAIILDQNMPKRNGIQTLKMLKDNMRYKNIPVMIYSTYADENLKKNCIEVGAVAVESKPLTKDGYLEMIEKLFSFLPK